MSYCTEQVSTPLLFRGESEKACTVSVHRSYTQTDTHTHTHTHRASQEECFMSDNKASNGGTVVNCITDSHTLLQ